MLTIGIDSGTQSTKCVILDQETGLIIASAQEAYRMIEGLPSGHLEQNPEDWVRATRNTIEASLEQIGDRRKEVVAIGVSGQQHGLVVLDKGNQVVRPAKLWCDTSTTTQCEQFAAEFGGARGLIELAGNQMLPGYTAPKILWLKQNEPANFRAAATYLLPHDYLNFFLTGEKTMEYGDASGTGLLNVRTREWCPELCDFIDPSVREALPPVWSSKKPAGLLREDLRKAWGLSEHVVVSAGGGDNMMGAIGTGNIQSGIVTASFGTSGTLYACSNSPVIDPEGEVAAFCDSADAWLPLVCTMNVTVATEQVRKLFGWNIEQFGAAVESVGPGADGLLFLPYLNGERTPNLPNGTGVFHGLTTTTMDAAHMARAAMEGATLGLAYGLNRFRDLGIKPSEIRLTGGGSKSRVWRQVAADIFNASTVCLTSSEGAALGAAVQGAWAYNLSNGGGVSLADLTARLVTLDESTRCTPNPATREVYEQKLRQLTGITRKLHESGYL